MKKKFLAGIISTFLILAISSPGLATSVSLNGVLSGVDSNTSKDDGDGNYDYAIDRTSANTFYWSAGSPISITGTVDVSGLTSGSYLQIGLVDKEQADLSLDTYWGALMFNNSAFATFYAGTSNYARLSDNNDLYSNPLYNPVGETIGVFDFKLDIASDGTMDLTLYGSSDASTTYTYGHRNWWDGDPYWTGAELENGSYLIAQLWIDTGDEVNSVSANFDITGASAAPVPEPATMLLLGSGLAGLAGFRRKFRKI